MFSPGIEPGTFRVLGGCDNHYTTKTSWKESNTNSILELNFYKRSLRVVYVLCEEG